MVRCNLSILLAERRLKITKVSNDTGISRTTLTYLANNYSKGIQYDTLNTLCNYLKIMPNQLISYIPIDIDISYVHLTDDEEQNLSIEVNITYEDKNVTCGLYGYAELSFPDSDNPDYAVEENRYKPCAVDIYVAPWDIESNPFFKDEILFTIAAFHRLPITFLKDIEREIIDEIVNELDYKYNLSTLSEPIAASLSWDKSLISNNSKEPPTTE